MKNVSVMGSPIRQSRHHNNAAPAADVARREKSPEYKAAQARIKEQWKKLPTTPVIGGAVPAKG
jgi:hypothetical protein